MRCIGVAWRRLCVPPLTGRITGGAVPYKRYHYLRPCRPRSLLLSLAPAWSPVRTFANYFSTEYWSIAIASGICVAFCKLQIQTFYCILWFISFYCLYESVENFHQEIENIETCDSVSGWCFSQWWDKLKNKINSSVKCKLFIYLYFIITFSVRLMYIT